LAFPPTEQVPLPFIWSDCVEQLSPEPICALHWLLLASTTLHELLLPPPPFVPVEQYWLLAPP